MTFHSRLLATMALLVLASPVLLVPLRASTWLPAKDIHAIHSLNGWAETLEETRGRTLNLEAFPDRSLRPVKAHLQGTADRIAHGRFHAPGYAPLELPMANTLSAMGCGHPDAMVLATAFADFMMNDPVGYTDDARHGLLPITGFSTPAFPLICKSSPMRSLGDLAGKRLRFPGGQGAKMAQTLGAVTVIIPGTAIYTSLTPGQLGCTANDITYLTGSQHLIEVSDPITLNDLTASFKSVMQEEPS